MTGASQGRTSHTDFATVAYAAANGAPLWVRRFNGGANLDDYPAALLASPRGGTVVVAGTSRFQTDDYAAVAYNTVTGAKKWFGRFNGDFHEDSMRGAAISPDGSSLYLTGYARIFTGGGGEELVAFTVAVNSATGTERWRRLDSGRITDVIGFSAAVSPGNGTVYVNLNDFTTLALQA